MGYTIKYRNLEIVCDTLCELDALITSLEEHPAGEEIPLTDRRQKKHQERKKISRDFWSKNKVAADILMRAHTKQAFLTEKEHELITLLLKGHTFASAGRYLKRSYASLKERMIRAGNKHAHMIRRNKNKLQTGDN